MTTREHKFEINYIFRNDPMASVIDAEDETLPQHLAAYHLLQVHRGDLPDAGAMPAADARPEDILHFAEANQIHDIRVSKVHAHPDGETPGHYQQP